MSIVRIGGDPIKTTTAFEPMDEGTIKNPSWRDNPDVVDQALSSVYGPDPATELELRRLVGLVSLVAPGGVLEERAAALLISELELEPEAVVTDPISQRCEHGARGCLLRGAHQEHRFQ